MDILSPFDVLIHECISGEYLTSAAFMHRVNFSELLHPQRIKVNRRYMASKLLASDSLTKEKP